ncbi:MAG: DPP IV N-terminal domain-containing protein [Actinomycetota bacterium]
MTAIAPTIRRAEAAFPGRNGFIAFAVRQCPCLGGTVDPPLDYDLFVVPSDGAPLRQVTQGSLDFDVQPAWAPDGRRIAFTRGSPLQGGADIYVMKHPGGAPKNLTKSPGTVDFGAAWSPDGRYIAFNSDQENPELIAWVLRVEPQGDLFVMEANGTNVVQLTSGPGGEISPSWSPDGRWIAFIDTELQRVGLIHPDGSGRKVLSPGRGAGPVHSVAWSPDGQKIVYSTGDGDIWVATSEGTQQTNLTERSNAENTAPVWSPDGRYIAFVSNREGPFKLFRMASNGSRVVKLTDIELYADTTPDWGPRP